MLHIIKQISRYIVFIISGFVEFWRLWVGCFLLFLIYLWGSLYFDCRDKKLIEESIEVCFYESDALKKIENEVCTESKEEAYKKEKEDKDKITEETFEIKSGENLSDVLLEAEFNKKQVLEIENVLAKKINIHKIRAGQEFYIAHKKDKDGNPDIVSLEISPELEFSIEITKTSKGKYISKKKTCKVNYVYTKIFGKITKNPYKDMVAAGADPSIVSETIKAFSYDINFQLDPRHGDSFCILYKEAADPISGIRHPRGMMFASFTIGKTTRSLYKFCKNGVLKHSFYNRSGESNQKGFIKTPIDGARLSSRYGHRHHPISGFTRMHKGIDFSAPVGTPVFAAGEGVIEKICFYGAYGRYLLIRHGNGYHTAYAHLSRFVAHLRVGQNVRQGQKIAFVGCSGRATGPHLHFEVLKNRSQINPSSVKQFSSNRLSGKDLAGFNKYVREVSVIFAKTNKKKK